jgi:hypothetical protein
MATSRLCSIPDCGKTRLGRLYCSSHHHRFDRYGDPLAGGPPLGLPAKHIDEVVLPYTGDDCIEWPFTRMSSGYGQVTYKGRKSLVHRLVCELTNGPPETPKLDAAHNCGNPRCVNPKHVRWATRTENLADRHAHGTNTIGERHGHSKLTEDDVHAIRTMLRDGRTQVSIASQFNVKAASIRDIKTGKNWGWLEQRQEPQSATRDIR